MRQSAPSTRRQPGTSLGARLTVPRRGDERQGWRAWLSPGWRLWLLILALAPLSFAVLYPLDQWLVDRAMKIPLGGGELKQELMAWQQYGAIGSVLFLGVLVWQMDPPRRVRLYDLAMAVGLVGAAVTGLKVLIGRARPGFVLDTGEPGLFVPAWETYPYPIGGSELVRNWEAGARLWSMPSSHTAYAAILSVFLIALYPRFRWIGLGLIALVGSCRVIFGAHYPSDVTVGACLGISLTGAAVYGSWGILARNTVWDYLVLPTRRWARRTLRGEPALAAADGSQRRPDDGAEMKDAAPASGRDSEAMARM